MLTYSAPIPIAGFTGYGSQGGEELGEGEKARNRVGEEGKKEGVVDGNCFKKSSSLHATFPKNTEKRILCRP